MRKIGMGAREEQTEIQMVPYQDHMDAVNEINRLEALNAVLSGTNGSLSAENDSLKITNESLKAAVDSMRAVQEPPKEEPKGEKDKKEK